MQLLAQRLDLGLTLAHGLLGGDHRGLQPRVVVIHFRVALDLEQLGARRLATLLRLGERGALTLQLGAGGGEARLGGRDDALQPPLLEVVLRDERALRTDLLVEGIEARPRGGRRGADPAELRLRLGDAGLQPDRLLAGLLDHAGRDRRRHARQLGLLAEQRQALVGEGEQRAQVILHLLQRERHAPRLVHALRVLRLLQPGLPQLRLVELLLQHQPFGLALALAAPHIGDRRPQLHDLVGEQARLRVTHDRRDRLRLARDLRLMPQRLELAPQLSREVVQSRQVGLHRLELAHGLLFATTVLEDARRLLDEAAALFGGGPQHLVELTLPDDDVHLAAEAGVGEQLLHIQQAALLAVDRVLAAAVAEQGAGDRDLGVLDRQRPVAVVDREADLGAAERPAGRGAGEDDVVHLAAAQRLGALLAHDPGQRIHDVRLAGAVGADDTGDAGFEGESRGLGERLEALEGQALQIHLLPFPAPLGVLGLRYPRVALNPGSSRLIGCPVGGGKGCHGHRRGVGDSPRAG